MCKRIRFGRALLRGLLLGLGLSLQPALAVEYETVTGVFCDSVEQAERYVVLFRGDATKAMVEVNTEAGNEKACGFMTVALLRGDRIATLRNGENGFEITRTLVIGFETPQGLRQAPPFEQFLLIKLREWMV